MQLTLAQLLDVAGRLDDTPGFDTPRERFRRFISKHVVDPGNARELIEQALHTPGQQGRRALQDLVVLLGRFFGFEVAFGQYEPATGLPTAGGVWRVRGQLSVNVAVWTDHTGVIEPGALVTRASALESNTEPHALLGILTPLFPAATRLPDLTGRASGVALSTLSLRALLSLAHMVATGRVTQDAATTILSPNPMLDRIVDLLDRSAVAAGEGSASISDQAPR
jgi:hypothetical protein